ncbi:hypothetical protein K502DRAFT_92689 [Neoconidiobolus thromboides FSU 785]|nr:hypothetical protein K502DRAFT_92689 [Neoconidiobolus thromboides FSU 785]
MDLYYLEAYKLIQLNYYHLSIIPLITSIIQKSTNSLPFTLNLLLKLWNYLNFNEEDLIDIFESNKVKEVTKLIKKRDLNIMITRDDTLEPELFNKYQKLELQINTLLKIITTSCYQPIKLTQRPQLRQKTNHYQQELISNSITLNQIPKCKIEYHQNKGNSVTSTTIIPCNSTIFTELEPIVYRIESSYKRNHCTFCCLKIQNNNKKYCKNQCKGVIYCNEECQQKDYKLRHEELCKLKLDYFKLTGFNELIIVIWSQWYSKKKKDETLLYYNKLPYLYSSSDVFDLINTELELKQQNIRYINILREYLQLDLRLQKEILFNDYIQLYCLLKCNIINLNNNQISEFGDALYFLASMVNHSCSSNSKFIINGKSVSIISRDKEIQVGNEISISYFPIHLLPYHLRKQYFIQTYNFYCECERCKEEEKKRKESILIEGDNSDISNNNNNIPTYFDLSTLFD